MSNSIMDIEPVDYVEGTFPDIPADNPLADDAMASSLAGIFTGHSETGKLAPEEHIDRASFSKVIGESLEYWDKNKLPEELSNFRSTLVK